MVWTVNNGYWAKEIEECERYLGLPGCEGLAEECAGLTEEEAFMSWWPAHSSIG
jgi:hypothetical protein